MVKKYLSFFIAITTIVLLMDQLSKYIIEVAEPALSWKIMEITLVKNTGAGFGILSEQKWLLMIISVVAVGIIIVNYKDIPKEFLPQFFTALFLGGILGNLADRFFRGYVIDFLNFRVWPAFNVADAAITVAAIGLLIYFWKK